MKFRYIKEIGACVSLLALSYNSVAELKESSEKINWGEVSGQVQSLTMARDYNDYASEDENGSSSTLAVTLNYLSPEWQNLQLGLQYVSSNSIFEHNPDRVINNNLHILNEAYLKYSFDEFGLKKTVLKAGRMIPDFLMMPGVASRQKKQSFEGILLRSEEIEDLKMSLGWIRKFSAWSTRHKNESGDFGFNYEFTDVADLLGQSYKTDGTYFMDFVYTGIEDVTLNIGDFYSDDIMNMSYVETKVKVAKDITWNGTYAHQFSVGEWHDYNNDIQSTYLDTGLKFQVSETVYIRPGYCTVLGRNDGDESHDFYDLFQSDLYPTWPMMANPYGFQAGSRIWFVESGWDVSDKCWAWASYTYTDIDNTNGDGYDGHEVNVMSGYSFTDNLSASVKLGVAFLDGKESHGTADSDDDTWATDARLFVTYKF